MSTLQYDTPTSTTMYLKLLAPLLCLFLSGCILTGQKNNGQSQVPEGTREFQPIPSTAKQASLLGEDIHFLITELDLLIDEKQKQKQQMSNTMAETSATPTVVKTKAKPAVTQHSTAPKTQSKPATNQTSNELEFGVHIASYQDKENLIKGWNAYQHKYYSLLNEKRAMMQPVDISGEEYWRLIVAPYYSIEQAQTACIQMQAAQDFCQVVSYRKE